MEQGEFARKIIMPHALKMPESSKIEIIFPDIEGNIGKLIDILKQYEPAGVKFEIDKDSEGSIIGIKDFSIPNSVSLTFVGDMFGNNIEGSPDRFLKQNAKTPSSNVFLMNFIPKISDQFSGRVHVVAGNRDMIYRRFEEARNKNTEAIRQLAVFENSRPWWPPTVETFQDFLIRKDIQGEKGFEENFKDKDPKEKAKAKEEYVLSEIKKRKLVDKHISEKKLSNLEIRIAYLEYICVKTMGSEELFSNLQAEYAKATGQTLEKNEQFLKGFLNYVSEETGDFQRALTSYWGCCKVIDPSGKLIRAHGGMGDESLKERLEFFPGAAAADGKSINPEFLEKTVNQIAKSPSPVASLVAMFEGKQTFSLEHTFPWIQTKEQREQEKRAEVLAQVAALPNMSFMTGTNYLDLTLLGDISALKNGKTDEEIKQIKDLQAKKAVKFSVPYLSDAHIAFLQAQGANAEVNGHKPIGQFPLMYVRQERDGTAFVNIVHDETFGAEGLIQLAHKITKPDGSTVFSTSTVFNKVPEKIKSSFKPGDRVSYDIEIGKDGKLLSNKAELKDQYLFDKTNGDLWFLVGFLERNGQEKQPLYQKNVGFAYEYKTKSDLLAKNTSYVSYESMTDSALAHLKVEAGKVATTKTQEAYEAAKSQKEAQTTPPAVIFSGPMSLSEPCAKIKPWVPPKSPNLGPKAS